MPKFQIKNGRIYLGGKRDVTDEVIETVKDLFSSQVPDNGEQVVYEWAGATLTLKLKKELIQSHSKLDPMKDEGVF